MPFSFTLKPHSQPRAKKWLRHYLALPTHHPFGKLNRYRKMKSGILKITTEKERNWEMACTAYNERFCVIAAVAPQIIQCKLASYYPAASSVEAATTQSRHHVMGKFKRQLIRQIWHFKLHVQVQKDSQRFIILAISNHYHLMMN